MEKRIVEIDGVKIEVDLRTAKVIDSYKVGDTVKILKKSWSDHYTPYLGAIVDFDNFQKLPTITVAYVDGSELKFQYIHAGMKDPVELLPYNPDEAKLERSDIVQKLNNQIASAEEALRKAKATKEIFLARFGQVFNLDEQEKAVA